MINAVDFWFEFASPYSYLSAMRIETLAKKHSVDVNWQPFILGPIFSKQGWTTSPFVSYPAKGNYMWRDMRRMCQKYGLALNPGFQTGTIPFPVNSVQATCVALKVLHEPWGIEYCRQIYQAHFARGIDISKPAAIASCIRNAGGTHAQLYLEQIEAQKPQLRTSVQRAEELGIFGAPSFVVDNELFWGNDRLEQALQVATHRKQN